MNKLIAALIAVLLLAGTAWGQARVDIHSTECGPRQVDASCVLTPHTFPDGEDHGSVWTMDCVHTTAQGFACPFKWPPGTIVTSSVGGNLNITASVRANFPGGNGLTTTDVCHEFAVACRQWPDLSTDTGADGKEQGDTFMHPTGSLADVAAVFTVDNTDETSFLHKKFGVPHAAAGVAGADCELLVQRIVTGGTCNATSATIGFEAFLLEFAAP